MKIVLFILFSAALVLASQDGATLEEAAKEKREAAIQATQEPSRELPITDLDRLVDRYAQKIRLAKGNKYTEIERFETAAGPLTFRVIDISSSAISLDRKYPAFLRIGKRQSTDAAPVIEDWLKTAREAKVAMGYQVIDKTKKSAPYGSIEEWVLKKGDSYFRTFFQVERIQGTYGSHSEAYTFYVETGLASRQQLFLKQQAAEKLGN